VAYHPSAEKRNRQNQKKRVRNNALRARMRTAVKRARQAITDKSTEKDALVKAAVREVYKAASMKVLQSNAASRTVARLMKGARA
jgi:small subunit ribosomal protein S20